MREFWPMLVVAAYFIVGSAIAGVNYENFECNRNEDQSWCRMDRESRVLLDLGLWPLTLPFELARDITEALK